QPLLIDCKPLRCSETSGHLDDLALEPDHLGRRVAGKVQPIAADLDEATIAKKPIDLRLDTLRAKTRADQNLTDRTEQIAAIEDAVGLRKTGGQFRQPFGK